MNLYRAKTPADYQELFYRQIGLKRTVSGEQENIWESQEGIGEGRKNNGESQENGFLYSYGAMDWIQITFGSYFIPSDFLVEYQSHANYLHFGILKEGITYSLTEDKLEPKSAPSTFLTIEETSGGVMCWKSGQRFRGLKVSVELSYLNKTLLPVLGVSKAALSFLKENVRYIHFPEEMRSLLFRVEQFIQERRMTVPLMIAVCLEFIALLIHSDNHLAFTGQVNPLMKPIQVGNRSIKLSREDFKKVALAHDRIGRDAASFITIYELSRELGISEQKLKAGFKELYRQTIWDYANSVRMDTAVTLLQDTELKIHEIARRVGYQSTVAFINMFKKWSGVTPGQFRSQAQSP